jgi:hypothetical protein
MLGLRPIGRKQRGRKPYHGDSMNKVQVLRLVAKRYSPYLNQFYQRIKQRRGGGKAKIALARKLIKIVYDTLKNSGSSKTSPASPWPPKPGQNNF